MDRDVESKALTDMCFKVKVDGADALRYLVRKPDCVWYVHFEGHKTYDGLALALLEYKADALDNQLSADRCVVPWFYAPAAAAAAAVCVR